MAALTHEMRGPLTAIRGWLHMLQSGQIPADRTGDALEILARNAARLSALVDQNAREADGTVRLARSLIDLRPLVDEVVQSAQPLATDAGVRLGQAHAPEGVRIAADANRIAQVVRNLVANAIKFTPVGGRVTVATALRNRGARLVVSDTGIGIPRNQLIEIFKPFRQADTSTRATRGMGLGLSIVQEVVHLHGGRVVALSGGPGKGSTFIVTIPRSDGLSTGDRP
jgi:signal transduction histidine kinase